MDKWKDIVLPRKLEALPLRLRKRMLHKEITAIQFSENICYYGPPKTGKTVRVTKLALQAIRWDYEHGKVKTLGFYSIPALLMRIRATFNSNSEETEIQIVEEVCAHDYLILDDLGAEKTSAWALQTLYVIINQRYDYMKPLFLTTNYTMEELKMQLKDERLVSRIERVCTVLPSN